MIQITFTFSSIAEAGAMLQQLNGQQLSHAAVVAEAPGKSTPAATEAAKPARGPRTAAAGAAAVVPEKTAAGSTPTAASAVVEHQPSTAADAPAKVAYSDLQKAVLTLHKMDPTKAVPIAKFLGAETFKALPEDKWADALRLVNEAVDALGVA